MSEKECLWQVMLRIFKEADKKEGTITSLCKKYGISRKLFYKWKKGRDKEGGEGLRSKIRKAPKMPNKVSEEIGKQILSFIKEHPTYGPDKNRGRIKIYRYFCWT